MHQTRNNSSSATSCETGDTALDAPSDDCRREVSPTSTTRLGRRGFIGLLGAGTATSLFGSRSALAQTDHGYGSDEYGLGAYGGSEDGEMPTPDDGESGDEDPTEDDPAGDADDPAEGDSAGDTEDPTEEDPDGDTEEGTQDDGADEDTASNVLTVTADAQASTATLSGLLWTLEDAESVTASFEYRQQGLDAWSQTDGTSLSSWGAFEQQVSGLSPSTRYEYRAVATSDEGTAVGEIQSFQTLDTEEAAPSVDQLVVETVSQSGRRVEFDVEWLVSDLNEDLESVTLVVSDYRRTIDWDEVSVGGATASGTENFTITQVPNRTYELTLAVTDTAGNLDVQRTQL